MAPKKAPNPDDLMSSINADDAELEQAIDDLRGVLQKDKTGDAPAAEFASDIADADPLAAFGGDFGSEFGATDQAATSDFGDGTDFAGGGDFGDTDFGDTDFGGTDDASMEAPPGSAMESNLDLIMDIPIEVQIVLGSSKMQVSGLMNLTEGATIALDRRIGEPVEVMVNGRIIGRGEITVLENDDTRFGVKLIEVKSTRKI